MPEATSSEAESSEGLGRVVAKPVGPIEPNSIRARAGLKNLGCWGFVFAELIFM